MVKKKIDNRIRVMIENGVKLKHRTMFVIVGDKARDQVRFKKRKFGVENKLESGRFQFCMICWLNLQ